MTIDWNRLFALQQWQESRNDPYAVSPVGASGLMGVMEPTLRRPGFGVRAEDPSAPDPILEKQRVGQDYMRAMYGRYGSLVPALAAYNWGPTRTDKWVARHGDISELPDETQGYIKNIAGGYNRGDVVPTRVAAAPPQAVPTPAAPPQGVQNMGMLDFIRNSFSGGQQQPGLIGGVPGGIGAAGAAAAGLPPAGTAEWNPGERLTQGLMSPGFAAGMALLRNSQRHFGPRTSLGEGLTAAGEAAMEAARSQQAYAQTQAKYDAQLALQQREATSADILDRQRLLEMAEKERAAKAEAAGSKMNLWTGVLNAKEGSAAIKRVMASKPATALAYTSPEYREAAIQAISAAEAGEGDDSLWQATKEAGIKLGLKFNNMADASQAKTALSDIAEIDKRRIALTTAMQTISQSSGASAGMRQGAYTLQQNLISKGVGAPLDIQQQLFDESYAMMQRYAKETGVDLTDEFIAGEAGSPGAAVPPPLNITPPNAAPVQGMPSGYQLASNPVVPGPLPEAGQAGLLGRGFGDAMAAVGHGTQGLIGAGLGAIDLARADPAMAAAKTVSAISGAAGQVFSQLPKVFNRDNLNSAIAAIKKVPGAVKEFSLQAASIPLKFSSPADAKALGESGVLAPGVYKININGKDQMMEVPA